MSASGTTSPRSQFDLSLFVGNDRQWKRPAFYLTLAGVVGFILEFCYLSFPFIAFLVSPSRDIAAHMDAILEHIAFDAFFLSLILYLALGLPRFLPSASSVVVDDDGLTLRYPSGRADHFSWSNPRDRFYIRDNSAYPRLVATGSTYFLYIPFLARPGRDRRSFLSKEAFDAIVRKAQERGATYRTWKGTGMWNGYPPQIHWIQGRRAILHE